MSEKYPTKRAYATGKLYKFLKEKGVYKKFVNNVKTENKERKEQNLFEIKGLKKSGDFMGAFTWMNTKEGNKFWYDLYMEFSSEQT